LKRREELAVGERANVDVDVKSGSVDVRTGTTGRVVVSIDADDVDGWEVAQLGDSVSIQSRTRRGWRVRSARVLVEVPPGSDVEVTVASADVALAGHLGAVRVRTASGDVRVDEVARLDVNSASGDTRVGSVSSDATCSSASGDVDLGDVVGRLVVSTASGDVRISSAADDVQIGSASGDVRVDRYDGANIAVKSISGDVTVGLPAGIRVEPDISTLSGRTTLPSSASPSASGSVGDRRLVRVRLRTVSGNITVGRVGRS
jgi:hypothetical protein